MPNTLQQQSLFANLTAADIIMDPFPHMVVKNIMDPDIYRQLDQEFPGDDLIIKNPSPPNNKQYTYAAHGVLSDSRITPTWREIFAYHLSNAFYRDFVRVFADTLREIYPELETLYGKPLEDFSSDYRRPGGLDNPENKQADVTVDIQFVMNSPVLEPTRVRGPHVDHMRKMFAGLWYFRDARDESTGGDLCLYRYKDDQYFYGREYDLDDAYVEPVSTIRYEPNTFVFWLNTINSLHGVTVRSATPVSRRFINIIGELNTLPSKGLFSTQNRQPNLLTPYLAQNNIKIQH